MSNVEITESAVNYLKDLLESQEEPTNIKIFVSDPGTMKAETCIVYCKVGEEEQDDILMDCLLYTSPSPRDATLARMPSSA